MNSSPKDQLPVLIALRSIISGSPYTGAPFERIDAGAPWLSTMDLGLTRGDGIFESIGVFGGQPLELEAHLDRLSRSAEMLDLPSLNLDVFSAAIDAAIGAHPRVPELLVKVIVTRGVEGSGTPSAWVCAVQNPDYAAERSSGVSAITLDRGYRHDVRITAPWLLQGAKTLSYAVNQAALREAKRRGAREVVFISSDGYALEGPTSTLMIRDEEGFRSPPPDFAVLPGTTQARIFHLLAQAGISVDYRAITLPDLHKASAIWLVSSGRLVVPVNLLDGVPVRLDAAATSLMQNELTR